MEVAPNGRTKRRRPRREDLPADTLWHLEKAFKKQWKRYRKRLKRCQKKFSARAIHASRVQTRRLLATVELLSGFLPAGRVKKMQRALKRHLDTFDGLRDTQVQLATVSRMGRTFPAARPFYTYLLEREERFSQESRKGISHIRTERLAEWLAACRADVKARRKSCSSRAANALLMQAVERAYSQTKRAKEGIDAEHPKSIHLTRVAFKKFRYMVEALADYLPGANQPHREAMRNYQTMMGNIQDAEVLLQTLDNFLRKKEIKPEAGRRLREELMRRRQWSIQVYLDAAEQLHEFRE